MKKKILSTLLAACLFIGVAMPSVMAATSDVAGDAKKVTKITMIDGKSEYDIKVGDTVDFADKIAVYEDNTKLVLDKNHIRYMLNGNTGTGNTGHFRIYGSEVTAIQAGSTATLTIFDNYNASSKARVTVTLKSVPGDAATWTEYAESFTFAEQSYLLPYTGVNGTSEGATLMLNAHPNGSKFGRNADEQTAILETAKNNVLPQLLAAMGLNSANSSSTIVGTFVDGKVASKTVGRFTFGSTSLGSGETLTFAVGGSTDAIVTGAVAIATAAQVRAAAIAAINAVADAKFVATADGVAGIVLTAKDANAGALALPTVTGTAGSNMEINGVASSTTAQDAEAIVVGDAAKPATITYDGDNATALSGSNKTLTIAGKSYITGNSETTVINQYTGFMNHYGTGADKIVTGYTAAMSTNDLVLTSTTTGPVTAPASSVLATNMPVTGGAVVSHGIDFQYTTDDDGTKNYKGIKITIPASTLSAANKQLALNALGANVNQFGYSSKPVATPSIAKFAPQTGTFTASTNVTPIDAIAATSFAIPSTIDVTVGKEVKVPVTYYPPNANVNKKAAFAISSAMNDGKPYQYAVINGDSVVGGEVKILGVNSNSPAKAILTGKVSNGALTAYSTINVKSTDFNPSTEPFTSKISATTVETKVGAVTPLNITGMPAGVTVKWVYKDNGVMDLANNDKASNAIIAKKVGETNIVATLSNGEKFTVKVVVAAADKTPETDVPQTGDSLFNF